MGFVAFLRKIGVIRYGVKTYEYTSGKDMPAEALMRDVYNAEKDLVTWPGRPVARRDSAGKDIPGAAAAPDAASEPGSDQGSDARPQRPRGEER